MIRCKPQRRPPCSAVLQHPTFWSNAKQLHFFQACAFWSVARLRSACSQDVSDRIEKDEPHTLAMYRLETDRRRVFDGDWHDSICTALREGGFQISTVCEHSLISLQIYAVIALTALSQCAISCAQCATRSITTGSLIQKFSRASAPFPTNSFGAYGHSLHLRFHVILSAVTSLVASQIFCCTHITLLSVYGRRPHYNNITLASSSSHQTCCRGEYQSRCSNALRRGEDKKN